jgi:hypothetical protein
MSEQGISVLVLYENFAVATVLLSRLLDMPMVHMVRAESASACHGRYDVVVVDPYLRAHRRADVLRRWSETPVLELCDLGGGVGVDVLCGDVADGPGQAVMSALRLPSVAA